jgi:imidazolonepropionase-like amidohydrolase
MVTSNAAYNFNLDQRQGSIENGKFANFFMINLNDPNYFVSQLTAENIFPLLVQRTKPENIKKVYIRGELAFERN